MVLISNASAFIVELVLWMLEKNILLEEKSVTTHGPLLKPGHHLQASFWSRSPHMSTPLPKAPRTVDWDIDHHSDGHQGNSLPSLDGNTAAEAMNNQYATQIPSGAQLISPLGDF